MYFNLPSMDSVALHALNVCNFLVHFGSLICSIDVGGCVCNVNFQFIGKISFSHSLRSWIGASYQNDAGFDKGVSPLSL